MKPDQHPSSPDKNFLARVSAPLPPAPLGLRTSFEGETPGLPGSEDAPDGFASDISSIPRTSGDQVFSSENGSPRRGSSSSHGVPSSSPRSPGDRDAIILEEGGSQQEPPTAPEGLGGAGAAVDGGSAASSSVAGVVPNTAANSSVAQFHPHPDIVAPVGSELGFGDLDAVAVKNYGPWSEHRAGEQPARRRAGGEDENNNSLRDSSLRGDSSLRDSRDSSVRVNCSPPPIAANSSPARTSRSPRRAAADESRAAFDDRAESAFEQRERRRSSLLSGLSPINRREERPSDVVLDALSDLGIERIRRGSDASMEDQPSMSSLDDLLGGLGSVQNLSRGAGDVAPNSTVDPRGSTVELLGATSLSGHLADSERSVSGESSGKNRGVESIPRPGMNKLAHSPDGTSGAMSSAAAPAEDIEDVEDDAPSVLDCVPAEDMESVLLEMEMEGAVARKRGRLPAEHQEHDANLQANDKLFLPHPPAKQNFCSCGARHRDKSPCQVPPSPPGEEGGGEGGTWRADTSTPRASHPTKRRRRSVRSERLSPRPGDPATSARSAEARSAD